jgi:hypothetical protein
MSEKKESFLTVGSQFPLRYYNIQSNGYKYDMYFGLNNYCMKVVITCEGRWFGENNFSVKSCICNKILDLGNGSQVSFQRRDYVYTNKNVADRVEQTTNKNKNAFSFSCTKNTSPIHYIYICKNSTDTAEQTTDKNKNSFFFSHSKNTSPIHYIYVGKNSTDSAEQTTDKNKNIFFFSHSKNTSPIHYIYIGKNSTDRVEQTTDKNVSKINAGIACLDRANEVEPRPNEDALIVRDCFAALAMTTLSFSFSHSKNTSPIHYIYIGKNSTDSAEQTTDENVSKINAGIACLDRANEVEPRPNAEKNVLKINAGIACLDRANEVEPRPNEDALIVRDCFAALAMTTPSFSFFHPKNTSPIHYIYIGKNSTDSSEKNTGTNIVLFGTKSNVKALSNINSFGVGKSITGTGNITEARKINTDNIYVIKILNFLHDFGVGKIRVVKLANTSYVVMKKNVYRKAICFIVSSNELYEQLTGIKKRIEKIKKVIEKIIKNNIVYTSSLYTVRYKL